MLGLRDPLVFLLGEQKTVHDIVVFTAVKVTEGSALPVLQDLLLLLPCCCDCPVSLLGQHHSWDSRGYTGLYFILVVVLLHFLALLDTGHYLLPNPGTTDNR